MTDNISEYFGERLAAIREALELKQATIGDILGCSNGAYSLYERNKRQPSLSVLFNLCSEFGVSIDYLLGCFSPSPDLFSERLQEVIAKRPNRSLHEFVEVFNLNEATEKLLLSGRCFPSAKTLKDLCKYFNCSSDFLVGLSDTIDQADSIPVRIAPTTIPRDPLGDLTPEQRAAIELSLKAFRDANAAKAQEA